MSRIQSVAQPSHNRPTLCVTKAASGSINLQDSEHGYTEAPAAHISTLNEVISTHMTVQYYRGDQGMYVKVAKVRCSRSR